MPIVEPRKTYCILKKGKSKEGLMRHPLYPDTPLIIDGENVAKQYVNHLQNADTSLSYTLVPSSSKYYILWKDN